MMSHDHLAFSVIRRLGAIFSDFAKVGKQRIAIGSLKADGFAEGIVERVTKMVRAKSQG